MLGLVYGSCPNRLAPLLKSSLSSAEIVRSAENDSIIAGELSVLQPESFPAERPGKSAARQAVTAAQTRITAALIPPGIVGPHVGGWLDCHLVQGSIPRRPSNMHLSNWISQPLQAIHCAQAPCQL